MLDIHSLLNGQVKHISPNENIWKLFMLWKRLRSKANKKDFDFESFFIGYTVGNNPTLKQRMLDIIHREKEIEETFK